MSAATCTQCQARPHRTRGLCGPCYERTRHRQIAYGTWESQHVDAQPVREHIAALREAGVGNKRIRELTGVSHNTVQSIMTGRPQRGFGPSKKVLRATAEKLLAIPVPSGLDGVLAAGAFVPALGSTRRLQALVAFGYSQRYLAGRIGVWDSNATRLFAGTTDLVTAGKARAVAALFAELQLVPGPDSRARNRGARMGWPMPMDWDEDELDDPTATATRSADDPQARLTADRNRIAERRDEVNRLTEFGMSADEIASRLRVGRDTVYADRIRLQAAS